MTEKGKRLLFLLSFQRPSEFLPMTVHTRINLITSNIFRPDPPSGKRLSSFVSRFNWPWFDFCPWLSKWWSVIRVGIGLNAGWFHIFVFFSFSCGCVIFEHIHTIQKRGERAKLLAPHSLVFLVFFIIIIFHPLFNLMSTIPPLWSRKREKEHGTKDQIRPKQRLIAPSLLVSLRSYHISLASEPSVHSFLLTIISYS